MAMKSFLSLHGSKRLKRTVIWKYLLSRYIEILNIKCHRLSGLINVHCFKLLVLAMSEVASGSLLAPRRFLIAST